MNREPVFIVGLPRSGTTLLAAMLAAHSRLSCGPETHFFRYLARVDATRLCAPETWPHAAVDFLGSMSYPGARPGVRATLFEKYRLDRDQVAACLAEQQPTVAGILRSVTEQYMRAKGKVRWVEKTPEHLLHTRALRTHFPTAPVLRIARDPRDVALALSRVPWGVSSFVEGLFYCDRLDKRSREFFLQDERCHTIRFEDLLSSPAETLRDVCRFVGEDFETGMLDTSTTGAEINSQDVPWKRKVSEPVDASRIGVWRSELTRQQNRLAEAIVGDQLEALGYQRVEEFGRSAELLPSGVAEKYAGALGALAAGGMRFWKAEPGETSAARVYLGDPGDREWLGDTRSRRAINALSVLADVLKAAVSDGRLYWVPDGDYRRWTGCLSFVLKSCLAPYRVSADIVGAGTS